MHAPPPPAHGELLALIEADLDAVEAELVQLAADRYDLGTRIQQRQARLVQLRRLKAGLRDIVSPTVWWDTVLIEDLVAGDRVRFEFAVGDLDVVDVHRNQDGRMVVRTTTHVLVRDADTAVRVQFPRPTVHHLPGIGVVQLDDSADVADVHALVDEAVAR